MDCFTNAELADMHLMVGAAQGNGAAAERMYRERFPGRKHPDRRTFERIHRELRTSGTFYASRRGTGIGRYRRTPSLEQRILNTVDNNPSTSLRAVGRALGVSHQSLLRTLHEDRMHPYHLHGLMLTHMSFDWPHLQHDGAPAHFSRNVRNHLDTVYDQHWIGREDFVARLSVAAGRVIDMSDVFSDLSRTIRRRCDCCVTVGGRTFEHLL
ncbi:uncharacterized protein TNCV_4583021 [Trichonephila clavipes]|nr:uncharacterized protein TNCV_4583021 [Trichonephila clavipes]